MSEPSLAEDTSPADLACRSSTGPSIGSDAGRLDDSGPLGHLAFHVLGKLALRKRLGVETDRRQALPYLGQVQGPVDLVVEDEDRRRGRVRGREERDPR